MNKAWERKPHDNPEWREYRNEDLFLCHVCNCWQPWFSFCKGATLIVKDADDTYKYMNDDKDRGGYRWACDTCINKILYSNYIITITDEHGKIIPWRSAACMAP
jgi:hypothetical protein